MNLGMGLYLSSAGQRYSPSQLAGIQRWYRADLGVTLATGVSQWNDQIGSAHLVQATGADQPTYNASDASYNNRPTIQSTATTQNLVAAGVTTTQPFTLWIVGQSNSSAQVLLSFAAGAPYIVNSSGNGAMFAGSVLNSSISITSKRAILATFNGASSFIGVDNWLTGGTSGAAGASNGTDLGAFSQTDGLFGSRGKLAEIIVQTGTPTASEKTAMAAYFLARYGITVT